VSGFDPGAGYVPLKPRPDVRVRLNLIRRPKTWGLWWSFHDDEGWFDGGCVSSHRTRKAAQAKARIVADWLEARDNGGAK
jgi:hypothetical protein